MKTTGQLLTSLTILFGSTFLLAPPLDLVAKAAQPSLQQPQRLTPTKYAAEDSSVTLTGCDSQNLPTNFGEKANFLPSLVKGLKQCVSKKKPQS